MELSTIKAPSDHFNCVIGHIEDIVVGSDFQVLQAKFLNKYYMEFDNEEENKIHYMDIFNEYTTTIEEFIMAKLKENATNIDLNAFLTELKLTGTQFDGEIYEFLFSLSDFQTFKSLMLDYKEYKLNENGFSALDTCITVTKLD